MYNRSEAHLEPQERHQIGRRGPKTAAKVWGVLGGEQAASAAPNAPQIVTNFLPDDTPKTSEKPFLVVLICY